MQIIGGINNTLLNHQWVREEIREEIKKFLEVNEKENTLIKTYGTEQRQS
jgi:hypothetical protein